MSRGEQGDARNADVSAVLIVEDDGICREYCARILRAAGCRVALAATASGGLSLLSSFRPQIVVSDLTLPDPPEQQRLFAACVQPGCDGGPALILMTAGDGIPAVGPATRCGTIPLLLKPFAPHELWTAVTSALPALAMAPQVRDQGMPATVPAAEGFRAALQRELERLDRHVARGEWRRVLETLHRLRGAAAISGYQSFALRCRQLAEAFAAQRPATGWGLCYLQLLRSGERVLSGEAAVTRRE